jgi:hypothetical protein
MIDIETSTLDPEILLQYVIYSFAERDSQIFYASGKNVLESMVKKARRYNLTFQNKMKPEDVDKLVKDREYRKFYSLFSFDDLCVLGY